MSRGVICFGELLWGARRFLLAATGLLAVSVASSTAWTDEIPGQPDRGNRPQQTLLEKPKVRWAWTPGVGTSNPTIFEETAYFGDDDGSIHALRTRDGTRLWKFEHGQRVFHEPYVDAEGVYVSTDFGLVVLNRKTGAKRWQRAIAGGGGAPLKMGRSVYIGGSDGILYAFDADQGNVLWEYNLVDPKHVDPPEFPGEQARLDDTAARPSGIAGDGQTVYQSLFDQSRIVAVDAVTGKHRWDFQTQGWIVGEPTVTERHVFIGSQDKHLYCLDKKNGEQLWKFATGASIASGAAVRGERVFVPSCDGDLYCLDVGTGRQIWTFRTTPEMGKTTAIYCTPLLLKEAVCFAAGEGQLYAVGLERGDLRWKVRPLEHAEMFCSPVTDGQRILVQIRRDIKNQGEDAIVAIDEEGAVQP